MLSFAIIIVSQSVFAYLKGATSKLEIFIYFACFKFRGIQVGKISSFKIDRQMDKQIIDRQTDRQTERQGDREREINIQIDRQLNREFLAYII